MEGKISGVSEAYFKKMEETVSEFKAKMVSYFKAQRVLFDGCSNAYFKTYNRFLKENPIPFSDAQLRVYEMWQNHVVFGSEYLECDMLPQKEDLAEFGKALIAAKVDYLAVTEQSPDLLTVLLCLQDLGFKFHQLTALTHKDKSEPIPTIVLRIPKRLEIKNE